MSKGLRAGLIVGAVVATIWFVSAIGVTLIRTDCLRPLNERCNNGVLEAYGDIVQLRWVATYQTLIAGFFAVIGGGFVYWTAARQRRWQKDDELSQRAERYRIVMHLLLDAAFKCRGAFIKGRRRVATESIRNVFDTVRVELGNYSPGIAIMMSTLVDEVEAGLALVPFRPAPDYFIDEQPEDIRTAYGAALTLWHFLMKADDFPVVNGKVVWQELPPDDLIEGLKSVELEMSDVRMASYFFQTP